MVLLCCTEVVQQDDGTEVESQELIIFDCCVKYFHTILYERLSLIPATL